MQSLHLEATKLSVAESLPAGSFKAGDDSFTVPAFCRVAGVLTPASDSKIRLEVWMPASNWNQRFWGVGNGGFAGSIDYGGMAWALRQGYATAGTDTGHEGIPLEAGWAFQHPEKIKDFGYRAIHLTALTAKAIVQSYYAHPPAHSYFASCSNGGRQALMEAQRYPTDYDGIVAGAPAYNWTHLLANAAANNEHLGDGGYIRAAKLPAIQAAALAQCDALDGVKDGLIQDPRRCHFNTEVLRCKGAEDDSCLTDAQLETLRGLYAGSRFADGSQIFPGYAPGTEAVAGGWGTWLVGAEPKGSLMFSFGTQFFKYMVFSNTYWEYQSFRTDSDTKEADRRMSGILNATDPQLGAFASRGGKLILFHGWGDAAIAPESSIDYYNGVTAVMGEPAVRGFLRLFLVPGMQHCYGGAAPNSFGQDGISNGDPENNILLSIQRWVEQGVAPEKLLALKLATEGNPKSKVLSSRPICAYPKVAAYKGSGSVYEAANFSCPAE